MERIRQYVSLSKEVSNWINKMANDLNMNSVDVIEVIIVFYYEYMKQVKNQKRGNKK